MRLAHIGVPWRSVRRAAPAGHPPVGVGVPTRQAHRLHGLVEVDVGCELKGVTMI